MIKRKKLNLLGRVILIMLLLMVSCDEKGKKVPIYVDEESLSGDEYATSGDDVTVPFREENGVKYVQVSINGLDLEMIFDTGCSTTLISLAEANYLYQKGLLKDEDILGASVSCVADGSIVENMVVNLSNVIIADTICCTDVQASVVANVQAPLLLGNEVLDRLATITIDNENKVLHFRIK